MHWISTVLFISLFLVISCSGEQKNYTFLKKNTPASIQNYTSDSGRVSLPTIRKDRLPLSKNKKRLSRYILPKDSISIKKDFLYTKYILEDVYTYRKTTRRFQWDKIEERLIRLDSLRLIFSSWAILENYKNKNGQSPLTQSYRINDFNRKIDDFGVERDQAIPLYSLSDTLQPVRYGRDGSPVRYIKDSLDFILVQTLNFKGEWLVPKEYVKIITTPVDFKKVIMIDRSNQNITTLEKQANQWLVRSMNPATTGLHNPPYQEVTPYGLFVIQEKKKRMNYFQDGSNNPGGFAPYASRFSEGGYIHGIPVNYPKKQIIEYSSTLGTTPRSHMCVRNATSHAEFIYNWGTPQNTFVFVFN